MIRLIDVTYDVHTKIIFENLEAVFMPSDRVGIIGRNGAGKSTLLKLIAGRLAPTSGTITIEKGKTIAYLAQEDILVSSKNVFDEVFSVFGEYVKAQKKIDEIEAAIADGTYTDDQIEELSTWYEKNTAFDHHSAEKETKEVLAGLGFNEETLLKQVSELSTGWKMRLALAKLLLTKADMYLLDEPTNHLDIVTQGWLLSRITSMKEGFLLVSHDQSYLEKACTKIFEIERGKGIYFKGNLKNYFTFKEESAEIARKTRAQQEREIEQKQAVVDRFRAGNRSQQAKNIMRQIDRIDLVDIEPPLPTINFRLPTVEKSGQWVLKCDKVGMKFENKIIFQSISGLIERGERVALVAANGVGKTTLLKSLANIYKHEGTVSYGHNVSTAFFEQDQSLVLSPHKSIYQELYDTCEKAKDSDILSLLGSFQFSGEDAHKKIEVLSGGEKNRVAMVKVLLQKANFLILDEPTNHLDMYSKDIMAQALMAYQGTILFVSHDSTFIKKVATLVWELTPNALYPYKGGYDEYLTMREYAKNIPVPEKNEKPTQAIKKNNTVEEKKDNQDLEKKIEKAEKEKKNAVLHLEKAEYNSDEYKKYVVVLNECEKELEKLYKEWEKQK